MSAALATLAGTDGVVGTVVFDRSGACVANALKPPYDPVLLAEVVKRLGAAFDFVASLDESGPVSLYAACEGGGVVFRCAEPHTLVVLTKPDANLSMVNVALNVAALNFVREANNTNISGPLTSSPILSSNLSAGAFSRSDAAGVEQIPPDAAGKHLVTELLTVFADYMGPAAKIVLKQCLNELGVSARTLRRGQWEPLLSRLAAKLPSSERRREFLAAAQRLTP